MTLSIIIIVSLLLCLVVAATDSDMMPEPTQFVEPTGSCKACGAAFSTACPYQTESLTEKGVCYGCSAELLEDTREQMEIEAEREKAIRDAWDLEEQQERLIMATEASTAPENWQDEERQAWIRSQFNDKEWTELTGR